MRKVVYIASPYSGLDPKDAVQRQIDAGAELIRRGMAPIIPLLYHHVHEHYPQTYSTWIDIDLSIVPRCDALLRLPGKSSGADKEVQAAEVFGIPVFKSIDRLFQWSIK